MKMTKVENKCNGLGKENDIHWTISKAKGLELAIPKIRYLIEIAKKSKLKR